MRWRQAPVNLKVSADRGGFVFLSTEMLHFSLIEPLGFWYLKGREGMPRYFWNKKLECVGVPGGSSFLLLSGETVSAP